jgi:hypothetical protein
MLPRGRCGASRQGGGDKQFGRWLIYFINLFDSVHLLLEIFHLGILSSLKTQGLPKV